MTDALHPGWALEGQIDAYGAFIEKWRLDHEMAKACWVCEEAIRIGLWLGKTLEEEAPKWRDLVFRGAMPAVAFNKSLKTLYTGWLPPTQEFVKVVEANLQEYDVEGLEELKAMMQRFQVVGDSWEPARISLSLGLRDIELPGDAADRLESIASGNTPEVPTTPVPQTMSFEEFRKLRKPA